MTFTELLETQWQGYGDRLRNRTNLLIHIVTVPVFIIGTINVAFAALAMLLFKFETARLLLGALAMGLALFAQQQGDALETPPPETGEPGGLWRRIVAEQFVTFPRFVISGGWLRNFRESAPGVSPPDRPPD